MIIIIIVIYSSVFNPEKGQTVPPTAPVSSSVFDGFWNWITEENLDMKNYVELLYYEQETVE